MSMSPTAHEYNKTALTVEEVKRHQDATQLDFQPALHVGMRAPNFTVSDLSGQTVQLSDFHGRKHVVFEFGCITAPVFINDTTTLNRLHEKFQTKNVQFLVIYTRESVPGGKRYQRHTSFKQKLAYARDLQREEGIKFPVVVDTLEGDAHRTYGLWPSPLYVVNKEGLIVYKSSWLIPEELEGMLDLLLCWERWQAEGVRPLRNTYSELWTGLRSNRAVHERVFARTGGDAREGASRAFGHDPVDPGK